MTKKSLRLRLAGPPDIAEIVEWGAHALGEDYFHDARELRAYMRRQRDSIWCIEHGGELHAIKGYAILLSLRPRTVERIRSGVLVYGRHILDTDLETSLQDSDAMYVSMVHGFTRQAGARLVAHFMQVGLEFESLRRPQAVLARPGTTPGRLLMQNLGFEPFGAAPVIQATYTDRPKFLAEARRRHLILPGDSPGTGAALTQTGTRAW